MFGEELREIEQMENPIDKQIADNQRLGEISAHLTYLDYLTENNISTKDVNRIKAVKESVDELLGISLMNKSKNPHVLQWGLHIIQVSLILRQFQPQLHQ